MILVTQLPSKKQRVTYVRNGNNEYLFVEERTGCLILI